MFLGYCDNIMRIAHLLFARSNSSEYQFFHERGFSLYFSLDDIYK